MIKRVPGRPGRALRAARLRAKITQAELASTLGVDKMTVSRAERNAQGISKSLHDLWLRTCEDLGGVE